jgi:monofunctional biosynthetic peptidoglycan transglycosylase
VLLLGPPLLLLVLRFVAVPVTPLMLIRLAQGYGIDHRPVPLDRIAPSVAQAVVASEDNLFCGETLGFDFAALAGQVAAMRRGARPRGASTITMQTAKNLFLWPGRDPVRKLVEAWLTPQMALLWPKRRVIETYLNIVEFGPGIYGAEAAAQRYFGRPAAELTRDQAVRLAVILPNPLHWSAADPGPWVRERTATIEQRMGQLGSLLGCVKSTSAG